MNSRVSSVTRLPKEVRDKITELRDGGATIDAVLDMLIDHGHVTISRSALGRHLKKQAQVVEEIRRARTIAEGIGRSFGDGEASNVARTNVELLHALILKMMAGSGDDDDSIQLDPKDAMFLATALEKAAKAQKADFETQLKAATEQERRRTIEQAATVAADAATKQGISAATVKAIRERVLGINKP